MITRPAIATPSSAPHVDLTHDEWRHLEDRTRLMESTVAELRALLDDPEHTAESVVAHRQATQELDRLQGLLAHATDSDQSRGHPSEVDTDGAHCVDLRGPRSNSESITVGRDGTHVVVTVHSRVDGSALHRTLTDLIDDQGNHSVRVELSSTDTVDSMGDASLIRAAAELAERGGSFELVGATAELGLAVVLIGGDPDGGSPDDVEPGVAMQHLYRLALTMHSSSPDDVESLVGVAVERLDRLTRELAQRAFVDLTTGAGPVDGRGSGACGPRSSNEIGSLLSDPW